MRRIRYLVILLLIIYASTLVSILGGYKPTKISVITLSLKITKESLSSTDPQIGLLGVAWDHTSLTVYILRVSWLEEDYIDAVKKAFSIWDRALEAFGKAYGYKYLSKFSFTIYVTSSVPWDYDILVMFSSKVSTEELGKASVTYNEVTGEILRVNITLYIYTTHGKLSVTDVLNVAMHEIGHALGLDHASSANTENGPELMYYQYKIGTSELRPSTLDAYGVAIAHDWLKTGIFKRPEETEVELPATIPYRMLLYYYVKVISAYGSVTGSGWYPEGAKAKISVTNTIVYLDNYTRAIFEGWYGDVQSNETTVEILVDKDYTIYAKWKLQYFVNITTPYASINIPSGWYDEGTKLIVSLTDYLIEFNNGTRRLFVKWSGDIESTNKTVIIIVDRPYKIIALWKTQYYIKISSKYSKVITPSGWYDANSKVKLLIKNTIIMVNDKTRLVFVGWNSSLPNGALIRVTRPLTYIASWKIQFFIEVNGVYSRTNVSSNWFDKNSCIAISLASYTVIHDNKTAHVFYAWSVNGNIVKEKVITIKITQPVVIRALWKTYYLTKLTVVDYEGDTLPSKLFLSLNENSTTINVMREVLVWLERGNWSLIGVIYEEKPKVSSLTKLFYKPQTIVLNASLTTAFININEPKCFILKARASKVSIFVKDYLGLPSPFIKVKIEGISGDYISDYNGFVISMRMPHKVYEVRLFFFTIPIAKMYINVSKAGDITLSIPIGFYTLIIIIVLVIVLSKLRRKGR